jgi:hypothetical protein
MTNKTNNPAKKNNNKKQRTKQSKIKNTKQIKAQAK